MFHATCSINHRIGFTYTYNKAYESYSTRIQLTIWFDSKSFESFIKRVTLQSLPEFRTHEKYSSGELAVSLSTGKLKI